MHILFDNNVPRGLKHSLHGHVVTEARDRGWETLQNGKLIDAAEVAEFDVLVTADKNLRYQQNLIRRTIAIVVLSEQRWTQVRKRLGEIAAAVDSALPGTDREVQILFRSAQK